MKVRTAKGDWIMKCGTSNCSAAGLGAVCVCVCGGGGGRSIKNNPNPHMDLKLCIDWVLMAINITD